MARRVFFSFHHERDIFRVNVVRNCWLTKPDREEAGYWDASIWNRVKRQGDDAVRRLIDDGLRDTSVTAVLIGAETAYRPWVHHEIRESLARGNAIIGVRIHNIADPRTGQRDVAGPSPLDLYTTNRFSRAFRPSNPWPVYDWRDNNGYANLGSWVETAALHAGSPLSA